MSTWSTCSLERANDGHTICCSIIRSCQSAATSKIAADHGLCAVSHVPVSYVVGCRYFSLGPRLPCRLQNISTVNSSVHSGIFGDTSFGIIIIPLVCMHRRRLSEMPAGARFSLPFPLPAFLPLAPSSRLTCTSRQPFLLSHLPFCLFPFPFSCLNPNPFNPARGPLGARVRAEESGRQTLLANFQVGISAPFSLS